MREIHLFFGWFNKHEILGFPADILAHLIVGTAIYFFLLDRRFPKKSALIAVLMIAMFKECTIDLSANLHHNSFFEPIKDVFFSVLIPMSHLYYSRTQAVKQRALYRRR